MSTVRALSPSAVDPVLAALERMEKRLDRIEDRIARAEALAGQATPLVATLTDTFDDLAASAGDAGIDLEERLHILASVAERLTSPAALAALRELLGKSDVLRTLVESHVFDAAAVDVVGKAARALAEASAEPPTPMGPWAALRAMRDPAVQRAVGFLIRVAKNLGEALGPDAAPPRLLPSNDA